ncbi:MAG: DUF177 domain-containing protein [Acidobacteriota bacterium]|nr:MAG: DUF177 domain-containing protein [Acidobacteriota bacterium]
MKIDLNRSDGSRTTFDVSVEPSDIELETDLARVKDDISAKGAVSSEDHYTVIEAEIVAPLEIDCSRCLERIPSVHEFVFKSAFASAEQLNEEVEVELDLQDLELSFAEDDEIDLRDVIREQIVLNLPARPLCREDCKGLCEVCGGNLNKVSCDCKQEETDPRWAALKNLK